MLTWGLLCRLEQYATSRDRIQSENGALHIANVLQKRDSLAVLPTVYSYFNIPVNCRSETSDSFGNFETRFASVLSKFNAHSDRLELPQQITVFMLVGGAGITNSHSVSMLAAAAKDILVG